MSLQDCDCHGQPHRVESLTAVIGVPDYANGEPHQHQHGVTWWCPKGLGWRERTRKTLEQFRRGYGRRRAA